MLSIITGNHPLLKAISRDVQFPNDTAFLQVFGQYTQAHGNARGLSAVQVGNPIRAMAVRIGTAQKVKIMCNPQVIQSSGSIVLAETCLSFPWLTPIKIERAKSGTLEYQNINGALRRGWFTDWEFRCMLHEIDHMNGITIDMIRRGKQC